MFNRHIKSIVKLRIFTGKLGSNSLTLPNMVHMMERRNFHTCFSSQSTTITPQQFHEKESEEQQLIIKLKMAKSKGGAALNKKEVNLFVELKLNINDLGKLKKEIDQVEFQKAIEKFNRKIVEKSKHMDERMNEKIDMTQFSIKLGEFVIQKNVKKSNVVEFPINFENFQDWNKKRTLLLMKTPTLRDGAGLTTKEIQFLKQFHFDGKVLQSIVKHIEKKPNNMNFDRVLYNNLSKAKIKPTVKTVTKILSWIEAHLIGVDLNKRKHTIGRKKEQSVSRNIEEKRRENTSLLEEYETELEELQESIENHLLSEDESSHLRKLLKEKEELISELKETLKELAEKY
ncbi:predicted protein [Naegleria gruberi]|uniref:Predicted protein n=1 Tax=Naegleria gruberi TaxID=5762 RepID=D2VGP8_NAEGR|nr:uncharacterized protein NAEGRDRAFT_68053 [Naegleria gruberi]EFC44005.1 predicted protein [Naegleria gruberi]|eukprot:XP_002676749.1 predicted protein [Naegleria gruberi strain NEG-M]